MIVKGGDGTALTHWEKRIFQNEAMTGTVNTAQPVYSRSEKASHHCSALESNRNIFSG